MVNNSPSSAGGVRSIPGGEAKRSHMPHSRKAKTRSNTVTNSGKTLKILKKKNKKTKKQEASEESTGV